MSGTKLVVVVAVALGLAMAVTSSVRADSLQCDMGQYKAVDGLTASIESNANPNLLVVTWTRTISTRTSRSII
jgi:hypothetical protein